MLIDIGFAVKITSPIFAIVLLGVYLKKIQWINDDFAATGSKIVFNLALPSLLFVNLVKTDFSQKLPLPFLLYAGAAVTLVFLFLHFGAYYWLKDKEDRGAFAQGAFRSNMGIIGLAYCLNAYSDTVLALALIYLAFMTVLYNILSTLTLTQHSGKSSKSSLAGLLKDIIKNPLIVAILLAMNFSFFDIHVPSVILDTGDYFARMSLPLALLCIGATIRFNEFRSSGALYWATFVKLLAMPAGITAAAVLFGFKGPQLGVLYLMCAAPTAAPSYPMVRVLGGNHHLAAAIIAATTLGSIFTTTLGIAILLALGLF